MKKEMGWPFANFDCLFSFNQLIDWLMIFQNKNLEHLKNLAVKAGCDIVSPLLTVLNSKQLKKGLLYWLLNLVSILAVCSERWEWSSEKANQVKKALQGIQQSGCRTDWIGQSGLFWGNKFGQLQWGNKSKVTTYALHLWLNNYIWVAQ